MNTDNQHPHRHYHRCQDILTQLNNYLDGDIDAELCHDLERHLEECPDCQIVLDTIAKTVTLYHTLQQTPMPLDPDVEARLLSRLKA